MARGAWLKSQLDWLRIRDLRLAAALAAIGVLAVVFFKLGRAVTGFDTAAFDEAILLGLRNDPGDPIGSPAIEAGVMHLSALGSGAVTGLIVLIATVFCVVGGRWRLALLILACSIGTLIGMELLKGFYDRPRPTVVTPIDLPGGMSFPSGHSMISAALYLTLGVLIARVLPKRRLKALAVATGALLALMIGATRVYLGAHYPTDVIAGWTAGAVWALVCGIVILRIGRRGGVESLDDAAASQARG